VTTALLLVLVTMTTKASEHKLQAEALLSIRENFGSFFAMYEPEKPYVYGRHTHALIRECQLATEAVERGECYYVIVNVPPRHGKSDVFSRRFSPWYLGGHPDHEIILASYSAELALELSIDGLNCFRQTAPLFNLKPGRQKANFWTVQDHKGKVNAVGLGGSITGKGAHVFIIDDYLKNRQEAESQAIRDHQWDSFKSDLWTRRAPVHAFIIVATRWHVDDLAGRIIEEHAKNPDFPKFKVVRFPAQNADGSYLFTERFPKAYYESQKALGVYAWQSLFQNDPAPRQGNLLRADLTNWISERELPAGLQWRRGWDLASTEKERMKDDPDYTVGTLAAFDAKTRRLYLRDVARGQWSALKRDSRMEDAAKADVARGCARVNIEAVGGYVDTYNRVRSNLRGIAVVRKVQPEHDKVSRASVLEPIFEAGNVYAVKGAWKEEWEKEFLAFPSGKHDDQVDSLVVAVYDQITKARGAGIATV
jgi:predicted phage terminase large subunit-like protein